MTLATLLTQLDGSGYSAYKRIRGTHQLTENLELTVDRAQSDPYAPPSLIEVRVPLTATGIKSELLTGVGAVAVGDHLTRRIHRFIRELVPHTGNTSGSLSIDVPGQQVLERSSVIFVNQQAVLRMEAALPAQGR